MLKYVLLKEKTPSYHCYRLYTFLIGYRVFSDHVDKLEDMVISTLQEDNLFPAIDRNRDIKTHIRLGVRPSVG